MDKSQIARLIGFIVFWILLAFLPLYLEIYYLIAYYIVAGWLLLVGLYWIIEDDRINRKFYRKWRRLRGKGFLYNVIRGTILSFLYMTVTIGLGQLLGNGRTPTKIISLLSGKTIWIILLLLIFSLIIGIVLWFENEKRYEKIHFHMQK